MLSRLRRLAAVAVLAATAAHAEPVVDLSLDAHGTPVARIGIPPGMEAVSFVTDDRRETHGKARAAWEFDRACFSLERDALRRLAPRCDVASIRLTWHGRMEDRMYPPVVKLANGGVLVFMQYLRALDATGRAMRWRVRAPAGGIAVARGDKGAVLDIEAPGPEADGRGWIYLGPDRFREVKAGRILVDEGVPPALEAEVATTAARLMDFFQRGLGAAEGPATLFVTWSRREASAREVQADVVPGGVVRVGLSGAEWGVADEAARAQLRFLIAHEMAHVWNAGRYRPMPWAAPWISEGSAEMFAIAGLLALGDLTEAEAADRIAVAFTQCALMAAGRAWPAMPERDRGRAPYVCGLALHFAIAGAGGAVAMRGGVLEFWRRAWERWPRYHEAVAQQHLRALGRDQAADSLREMMTLTTVPLTHSLRRLLVRADIPVRRAERVSDAMGQMVAGHAFMSVMQGDCGGNAAFFMGGDHLMVGNLPCGSLVAGMRVRRMADRDLFADPVGVLVAARRSCRETGFVTLATLDGTDVRIACREAAIADPDAIVALEPKSVRSVLLGRAGSR